MIEKVVSQYIQTMFKENRKGKLMVGDADDRYCCAVDWDAATAAVLAKQCSVLVGHFQKLAARFETVITDTSGLTMEELEVWNTYLKPFPKHGLDRNLLTEIWEKFHADEKVADEERALVRQWVNWFERNALLRLPIECCYPTQLIYRAQRYCRLIRLGAPEQVQEWEAKRFAEEYVLYHCKKPDI